MYTFKSLKYAFMAGAIALSLVTIPLVKAEEGRFPKLFKFAKNAMRIERVYDKAPLVRFVSQETLVELYRLAVRHSGATLDPETEEYLKESLSGSFHSKVDLIYVLKTAQGSRREELITHEYAHWLQVSTEGVINKLDPDAVFIHWVREERAYKIGRDYIKKYYVEEVYPND